MPLRNTLNLTRLGNFGRLPQFRGAAQSIPPPRPPPAGARPPRAPRCSAPPLTCDTRKETARRPVATDRITVDRVTEKCSSGCDTERDHVARRLALAERARRVDYEREVSRNKQTHELPSSASLYRLVGERECAQATDGRQYAVLCPPTPETERRCGPDRTPPPPRCVELIPDGDCQIRKELHLDPCARRSRILLEVERSTETPKLTSQVPKSSERPTPTKKISSRIMETFNLKRTAAFCPKRQCKDECDKSANNTHWCKNQPTPVNVPPSCREPTLAERLRSRGSPFCRNKKGSKGTRDLHTSAKINGHCSKGVVTSISKDPTIDSVAFQIKSDAEKLNIMLQDRKQLKEAGQGRMVQGKECKEKNKCSPSSAGLLDIPVPPGTENVRVHVSLWNISTQTNNKIFKQNQLLNKTNMQVKSNETLPTVVTALCSHNKSSAVEKSDSWLSIKRIQKKFAGRKKTDSSNNRSAPICSPLKSPATPPSPCTPQSGAIKKERCPPPCPKSTPPSKGSQGLKRFSSVEELPSNVVFIKS